MPQGNMRVGKEGADPSGAPDQKKAADVWSPEHVCEERQPVSKEHSSSTVAIDYTRCGHVSHLSNSANGFTPVQSVPQEGLYSLPLLSSLLHLLLLLERLGHKVK